MREHATHFDGCDCLMEKISTLTAKVKRCENELKDVSQLKSENARYREALELYADPWKHKEKIEDETSIPDFYGETDFGMFAREALKGEE